MKKWYLSKTLWVNFISMVAIGLQAKYNREIIPVDAQAYILGAINLMLRVATTQELK